MLLGGIKRGLGNKIIVIRHWSFVIRDLITEGKE